MTGMSSVGKPDRYLLKEDGCGCKWMNEVKSEDGIERSSTALG